ncbi:hypothetical protein [Mucilaginibacter sp.]|uniref:hypothetical protein n=1 Tax=Mucilaginibacter sp. TaxID=1882438 RepID=UPI00374DE027
MDFNHHVKFVIDLTTCPVHNQKAVIGISSNNITFKCCCADFEITCLQTLIKLFESDSEHMKKYGKKGKYPV